MIKRPFLSPPLPAEGEKVYPVHSGFTSKTRSTKGDLQPTHAQLIEAGLHTQAFGAFVRLTPRAVDPAPGDGRLPGQRPMEQVAMLEGNAEFLGLWLNQEGTWVGGARRGCPPHPCSANRLCRARGQPSLKDMTKPTMAELPIQTRNRTWIMFLKQS